MKKLQLRKDVVARLNNDRMNQVKGGAMISTEFPPFIKTTDPGKCIVIGPSYDPGCELPVVTLDTDCNQVSCNTCESCMAC